MLNGLSCLAKPSINQLDSREIMAFDCDLDMLTFVTINLLNAVTVDQTATAVPAHGTTKVGAATENLACLLRCKG
jgi:hypothetical protein